MSTETTAEAGAALVTKVATAAQYGGSGSALVFGLTSNEIAAYGGLLIGVLGFLVNTFVNWYYKAQHLKLAKRNQSEFYD
jgi:uncharacterized membrane protein